MAKSDNSLREDKSLFDMLAEYGAWAVVAGVIAEVAYALEYPAGKTFWESWIPVFASGLIALGVVVEIVSTRKSTEFSEELDRRSNEKVAAADERAASALERAAKAELETQQIRKKLAPRHLKHAEFVKYLEDKPKSPVEIMFVRDDADAFTLSLEIRSALREANWTAAEPVPIPTIDQPIVATLPSAMTVGGQPSGVTVVAHSLIWEEISAPMARTTGHDWPQTPYTVLSYALGESLGSIKGSANTASGPSPGKLRVVVGPKE